VVDVSRCDEVKEKNQLTLVLVLGSRSAGNKSVCGRDYHVKWTYLHDDILASGDIRM
jgi:hypothetical protein